MNQYQWTFLDNERRRHNLGIAHSPTSGHLVVYCDARVMLIEFSVLKPRVFPFFIEDELCKLSIEGSVAAGFTYGFEIDTQVDTEVNRLRQQSEQRRRRSTWIRASAMVLFGLTFVIGLTYWGHHTSIKELPLLLRGEGLRAEASVSPNGTLEYIAGNQIMRGQPIDGDEQRLAPLVLAPGVELPVLYDADAPRYFVVDWRLALTPLSSSGGTQTDFTRALLQYFAEELPPRAGGGECALRVAERLGGLSGQLSLVDAYLRDDPVDLATWRARFAEPAYRTRMQQVCAPPTEPVARD